MLSGAILGGIFASPSVSAVLAAIRAASNSNQNAGVLLIVKNYTGDRLSELISC
jgi:dihydroxyacetone kinase